MKKRVNKIFIILFIVEIAVNLFFGIDFGLYISIPVIVVSSMFLGVLYYIVNKLLFIEELLLSVNRSVGDSKTGK